MFGWHRFLVNKIAWFTGRNRRSVFENCQGIGGNCSTKDVMSVVSTATEREAVCDVTMVPSRASDSSNYAEPSAHADAKLSPRTQAGCFRSK